MGCGERCVWLKQPSVMVWLRTCQGWVKKISCMKILQSTSSDSGSADSEELLSCEGAELLLNKQPLIRDSFQELDSRCDKYCREQTLHMNIVAVQWKTRMSTFEDFDFLHCPECSCQHWVCKWLMERHFIIFYLIVVCFCRNRVMIAGSSEGELWIF